MGHEAKETQSNQLQNYHTFKTNNYYELGIQQRAHAVFYGSVLLVTEVDTQNKPSRVYSKLQSDFSRCISLYVGVFTFNLFIRVFLILSKNLY